MKKRKVLVKTIKNYETTVYENSTNRISKENDDIFFEIGTEITSDVSEAVAILMKNGDKSNIWDVEINIDSTTVTPEKSLYWLTGGHNEWKTLDHYNTPWVQCYLIFQEEYGLLISSIIEQSKTLRDVKNGFEQLLNLPDLYEFALSKNLIK